VLRIEVSPKEVTARIGEAIQFSATGYDGQGNSVGGVAFQWRATARSALADVPIDATGKWRVPFAGQFEIQAEAVGLTGSSTVNVLDPDDSSPLTGGSDGTLEGWTSNNVSAAFRPNNLVGHHRAHRPPEVNGNSVGQGPMADEAAGSANFQIVAPVVDLPGRGLNTHLDLTYNSRLWSKWEYPSGTFNIGYNLDNGWPAPGWRLGFVRLLDISASEVMLVEADGTRHPYQGLLSSRFWAGGTTDGGFIAYNATFDIYGYIDYGQAQYPDGTVVDFGRFGYATKITDAQGNFLTITYTITGYGPYIDRVVDTLGRTFQFVYDQSHTYVELAEIRGPDVVTGTRSLMRLQYRDMNLLYNFGTLTVGPAYGGRALEAIYYPATSTGYWFGDTDSYSSYGMLAKVVQQRGMGFDGTLITRGTDTYKRSYDYPLTPGGPLSDAPTFQNLTETWASMDGSPNMTATTGYDVQTDATHRTVIITLPNLNKVQQLSFNHPGLYDDGLVYQEEERNAANALLRGVYTTWMLGLSNSALRQSVTTVDDALLPYRIDYTWHWGAPASMDYIAIGEFRYVSFTYSDDVFYGSRHILYPLTGVEIFKRADRSVRVSKTDYVLDGAPLVGCPGITQYQPIDPPSSMITSKAASRDLLKPGQLEC